MNSKPTPSSSKTGSLTTVKAELIALEIAHHTFVDAEDGYLSTAVHDNERAASIVLEWLQKHDREVAAAAWAAALHHVQPHLAADLHRAAQADNPYRTKEA